MLHAVLLAWTLVGLVLFGSPATTSARTEEDFLSSFERNRVERHLRRDPCIRLHGEDKLKCVQLRSKPRVSAEERREVRNTRARTSRRIQTLYSRRGTASAIISRITNQAIDLRPYEDRRREAARESARKLRTLQAETSDDTEEKALARRQRRARAGDRKNLGTLPVCLPRRGERLIRCLEDEGFTITSENVDRYTWSLYQRTRTIDRD